MAELKVVALDKIRIPEVRVSSILDEEQRALLSSTIKEIGTVQDIVVREISPGEFELIAGKSRLQELRTLGFKEYAVKVVDASEKLALIMNITENVARGVWDYISVAQSIRKLRSMGTPMEELERIFPWRSRWIQFIEELQDLPEDVAAAISARKITPTHVQIALNLPTPFEVHDGLKTAINLEWDTGTFKTFVQNRVAQIEAAKAQAEAQGVEPEIPPPNPQELIQYTQCLLCGYKKPREQVIMQQVCEACRDLIGYITHLEGPPEDAIKTVYTALQIYHGQRPPPSQPAPGSTTGPAQE